MRTTTYRNVTANPNFELIKNYFDKFATTLNCQSHTKKKWCKDDTADGGVLEFFETSFSTFNEGSITIRYYLQQRKYTAIFENEYVRLRVYFATSTKGGNTVRLYDGSEYYHLDDDYLRNKDNLDDIIDFIDGIMYSEGESEFEDNLYFKTKI